MHILAFSMRPVLARLRQSLEEIDDASLQRIGRSHNQEPFSFYQLREES